MKKADLEAGGWLSHATLRKQSEIPKARAKPIKVRGREYFRRDHTRTAYHPDDLGKTGFDTVLFPKVGSDPCIEYKGEKYFNETQVEECRTRTAWKNSRRKVSSSAVPAGRASFRVGGGRKTITTALYRESDTLPIKSPGPGVPPKDIDVLKAIWAVNKAAKRYRDSGQKHYRHRQHGFAGWARERKEELYDLKDRGIKWAVEAGLLALEGIIHNMAVYRGGGYCFHSFEIPEAQWKDLSSGPLDENIFIESRPRVASEARLKDAEHTIRRLLPGGLKFKRLKGEYW